MIKTTKRTGIEYRQIKTPNGSLAGAGASGIGLMFGSGVGLGVGVGVGGINYSLQTPETQYSVMHCELYEHVKPSHLFDTAKFVEEQFALVLQNPEIQELTPLKALHSEFDTHLTASHLLDVASFSEAHPLLELHVSPSQ